MVDSSRCNTISACREQVGETPNSGERFIGKLLKSVSFAGDTLSWSQSIYPMNPIGVMSAPPLTHPYHVLQRALGPIGLSRRHQQLPQATDLQQIETAARLLLTRDAG
jgi:hypothetical protein